MYECAVVLWNLALAHHQQAKIPTSTSSSRSGQAEASLRQALVYYQECYQALQSLQHNHASMEAYAHCSHTVYNDDDDDWLVLMTLAVTNNQAHLLYELQEDSCHHVQQLLTGALHALHIAACTQKWSVVEIDQMHEFVQNAMVFRLPRACAAPTA